MKGLRWSVVVITLAGLMAVSLLGSPVGTVALAAAFVVMLRTRFAYPLPDGLWNLLLLSAFVVIALWVGGWVDRVPTGLALALVCLQVQRSWQSKSHADEVVLAALALIELILVGSQTTSPVFLVAWFVWLASCPFVLMGPMTVTLRMRLWIFVALLATATLFFVSLPRFQSPALEPGVSHNAVIGFAEDITLGDLGELLVDNSPVLRVRVDTPVNEPLYFRGVSMDTFDGTQWHRSGARSELEPVKELTGLTTVEVLAEAGTQGVLFTMGQVRKMTVSHGVPWRDQDNNWFVDGPAGSKRYTMYTDLNAEVTEPKVAQRWSQWPGTTSVRLQELAETIAGGSETSASEKMERLTKWLRENTSYTRAPRDTAPEDPLDAFLFERQTGHCEYFASALAVMLRTQGVPTRVVNGFLGGEYNELGDYWVVRQAHAHAWVEALDERNVWRRLDATPQEIAPPVLEGFAGQWSETAHWWWMNQVVAYDRRAQWELARAPIWSIENLFADTPDADDTKAFPWMGLLICLSALVAMGLMIRRIWMRQRERWLGRSTPRKGVALVHDKAWAYLQDRGWRPPEGLPRLEGAHWMADQLGVAGETLRQLVWLHYRVQFGGERDADLHPKAQELLRQIRKIGGEAE